LAYLIAAIIILIIILILIGILLVPFQISMNLYRRGPVNEGHFKLSWLRIRLIHRKIPSEEKKPKKEKKERKEEKKVNFNRIPKILMYLEESLPSILRIFQAFLRSVSIKRISINSIIGLESPVDTAILNGYLLGLASIINIFPKTNFTVDPDFNKERIDGSILIEIKLRLLWIVIESLKAFTKKPVRSLFGELRKMRG